MKIYVFFVLVVISPRTIKKLVKKFLHWLSEFLKK